MKIRALGQWLDDHLNPIVVKELRQAVQSRFVTAVLLFFLILQLTVVGIFIAASGGASALDALEFQHGRHLFSILQCILLGTCVFFLPAYAGIRLAAERSTTNTDLLFVTTLPPRAIISGKFRAAFVLAILIFSACTPFLVFTYLLRGIDWASIFLIINVDLAAVAFGCLFAIFLAVVPGNWLFKALLGLIALAGLGGLFAGTLALSIQLLFDENVSGLMETASFWGAVMDAACTVFGVGALFFSWAVALISPPAANRALLPRLVFLIFWAGSLAVALIYNDLLPEARGGPLLAWIIFASILCCLHMVIAVNEREHWSPRVARTIPSSWWLRLPAFLFYSGAAGGLILYAAMLALTLLVAFIAGRFYAAAFEAPPGVLVRPWNIFDEHMKAFLILGLYVFCYVLAARFVRRVLPIKIPRGYTWVLFLILIALGNIVPFLSTFFLFYRTWQWEQVYGWLLPSPIAGIMAVTEHRLGYDLIERTFLIVAGASAAIMALLHLPWFVRQISDFRPFVGVRGAVERLPEPTSLIETQASG